MKITNFYAVIIFLLILVVNITAMGKYRPHIEDPILESWRWRHFSFLDGKGVRSIDEDNKRNTWFGCAKGVVKYNGLKWTTYDFDDQIVSTINVVFSASNGRIFAGSRNGIRMFDGSEWSVIFPKKGKINLYIKNMIELHDHSILISTVKGLIHILNDGEIVVYTNKVKAKEFEGILPPNDIKIRNVMFEAVSKLNFEDVLEDKNNKIWIAAGYGEHLPGRIYTTTLDNNGYLKKFNLVFKEDEKVRFSISLKFIECSSGEIWVVTSQIKSYILRFKDGKVSRIKPGGEFGEIQYSDVVEMSDNTMIIGGIGRFFAVKSGKWKEYKPPIIPISSSNPVILFKSSDGNLWVANRKNEVFLLDYNYKNWITYKNLNYEAQEKDGTRWYIDIAGNIVINKGDKWNVYTKKDGILSTPTRVFITKKNQVWMSGSDNGIAATAYLRNGEWHKTTYPKLSWGIDQRAVYEDISGNLYFGASINMLINKGQVGGLIQYRDPYNKPDLFTIYTYEGRRVSSYGIAESKDGWIWIAGTSMGSFHNGELFNRVFVSNDIGIHEDTDCIHVSKDTTLWVGNRNNGLFSYDGENWVNYDMENGLVSNSITSIASIGDTSIWVSTSKDISHFDGNSWSNYVYPKELNISREGGGIRIDNYNNIWINKATRKWYRRALNNTSISKLRNETFRTVFCHPDTSSPITKIVYYEKEIPSVGNAMIQWTGVDPYNKTPVEFLQYSYKLDDNDWTPFSFKTSHLFLQLSSGHHELEVRSRDSDFNIDHDSAKIEFFVLYPFYLRASFLVPIILLLIISTILLIRVIKRGRIIRKAKKETDEILKNIKQGLLLLDKDYRLGSQYSAFLKSVFGESNLGGRKFVDLLRNKISDDDLDSIEIYLDLLFKPDVNASIVDDLNPLEEIKLNYPDGAKPKYFSFSFRKISETGDDNELIEAVMVVVQDITEQVTLGKELESAKEDANRKMNWLLDILHVEPGLLKEFLNSAEEEISNSLKILNNQEILKEYQVHLETIFRSMHLLKGNAGLLSLKSFAEETHSIEDGISELQKKNEISQEDIDNLRSEIEIIAKSIDDVTNLLDKLSSIHNQMNIKGGYDENKQLVVSLKNLIKTMSEDENKKIRLVSDKFDFSIFPANRQLIVRETIIQLTKNAIVHGIEVEEDRDALNKEREGVVEITTFINDNNIGYTIRDDGSGINIEKVKNKLIESAAFSQEKIADMSEENIAMSIFSSGISTADRVNINAGRGVGLGAVKEKVESHSGTISISFKEDEFCEFTISFPKEK